MSGGNVILFWVRVLFLFEMNLMIHGKVLRYDASMNGAVISVKNKVLQKVFVLIVPSV